MTTRPPTRDEMVRGIAGRVLAADTYRNMRLEVCQALDLQGQTTDSLELHVAGLNLGVLAYPGTPDDELSKLRRLVDGFHSSAGQAP
jgi:hypothetical protein